MGRPEHIANTSIGKRREVKMLLSQGQTVVDICQKWGAPSRPTPDEDMNTGA